MYMSSTTQIFVSYVVAFVCVISGLLWAQSAFAAPMTLRSDEDNGRYYALKAKVAYLTAFVDALREGEYSPQPTFIVVLDGNIVSVVGTLARDPQPERMEICGPLQKGTVDWGDGTVGPIMGLGCSGDVHEFAIQHAYRASDSYRIEITDSMGRDQGHVVAVQVKD